MAYTPPDDGRKFTELYSVQRVGSAGADRHAQVCISTIQRLYAALSGEPLDESTEDIPAAEVAKAVKPGRLVSYSPELPVKTFDFIVIDECHRSIYSSSGAVERQGGQQGSQRHEGEEAAGQAHPAECARHARRRKACGAITQVDDRGASHRPRQPMAWGVRARLRWLVPAT